MIVKILMRWGGSKALAIFGQNGGIVAKFTNLLRFIIKTVGDQFLIRNRYTLIILVGIVLSLTSETFVYCFVDETVGNYTRRANISGN